MSSVQSAANCLVFLVVCLGGFPAFAAEPADLVLRGGKIITIDDRQPEAEALAIKADRILAVGTAAEIAQHIGPQTRVIELAGRMAMPGFIEGHGHFLSLGDSKRKLDLSKTATWDEIVALVAKEAAKTPAGQWIVGRGWHQGKWNSPPTPNVQGYPTHEALSRVTPDHPVLLTHGTGHMSVANAKAMELASVTRDTAEIAGGEILRDSSGNPTGVFRENAARPIRAAYNRALASRSPEQVRADRLAEAELAAAECIRHGVTSFQDAGSSAAEAAALRELAEAGKLPVRLWIMLNDSNDVLARRLAETRVIGAANNHFTVRGIKRLVDGAIGTHGAWLLQPYDDLPGSTGNNTLPLESLERTAELAIEHNYQLCVHAIGDRANREVLDLFDRVFQKHRLTPTRSVSEGPIVTRSVSEGPNVTRSVSKGPNALGADLRWRIEHAQHIDPADIPRFGKLGVIASMQAVHATSDAPFVIARLGQRRAQQGAYAWRSLLDAGATVINGTDVPVESIDPLACFYSSITRKLKSGATFFPEQSMTRPEALRSYTAAAAFAAFEDDLKGTLTPGKLADLIILSHNLLTAPEPDLLKTRVELTILGGKVVYEAAR